MASALFLYMHVILMCQMLTYSDSVSIQPTNGQPTEQKNSCYPQGRIVCKMWNHTSMDCSNRDLVCIPQLHHAASIKSFDLSANQLRAIPDNAFLGFHTLQHLDLSLNHISSLHGGAFSGLHELLSLTLPYNIFISYIKANVFSRLQKLQHLDLSAESIEDWHDDAFAGLDHLLTLDLNTNLIPSLHDGAFTKLQNLLNLDLSWNSISFISDKAFGALRKLTNLNLNRNYIVTLPGSPFQDLIWLQTLQLDWQNLSSLSTSSLRGLDTVQSLRMTFHDGSDNITGTPLASLKSLRELYIYHVYNCDQIGKLFTGLYNLQYLDIMVGGSCPEILFCSSYQKHYHFFNASKKCNRAIPLKHLKFVQIDDTSSLPAFKLLYNLSSLYLGIYVNVYGAIEALNMLDSPLLNLTLILDSQEKLDLTSTTFASWGNWKASLQVLKLSAFKYEFEGTPFEWFTDLQILQLESRSPSHHTSFVKYTSKGIRSLNKIPVAIPDLPLDSAPNNTIIQQPGLVDPPYNLMSNDFDFFWKQLCNMSSSLRNIDLTGHALSSGYPYFWPCSPPNLKVLEMGYPRRKPVILSTNLCEVATQLEYFDVSASTVFTPNHCTCPQLITLILSECAIDVNGIKMHLPGLRHLFLNGLVDISIIGIVYVLNMLKAPNLENLYLRGNQITDIDNKLVQYFRNLTYLDLRNNKLTSVSNLQDLRNIKSLLLSNNAIKIVHEAMLTKSSHPNMSYLDVGNNPFKCDCNVEAFRNWLLTDNMVHLNKDYDYVMGTETNYQCFSPDSRKGLGITQVNLDCGLHLWKYISIGITCAIIILISVILIVRYRWHIQYGYFLMFHRRRQQQHFLVNDDDEHIDDDENGIPRYDAYVPYHIEDEDWVDGELLANIEEGEEPFRLCLKARDIRAGRPIFGELSLHIQRSRKILVILSPRFVEDNWCYFELNMAHHRVLEEGRNVMILIILEEIPNNKMTLLLRQLFCRVQCIKWPGDGYGQYLFWRRLREELKRPVPLDRRFNV